MVITAIATLLSQKIGFDSSSITLKRIARAIATRQAISGLSDPQTYLMRVQASCVELDALIEELVVPETWFFRDSKPFEYLQHYVADSARRWQILSVPCSTGEEPYSIAIAFLEAGVPPERFAIDAIDISYESIAKAQRGIYTKNSFRGKAWIDPRRYFQPTSEGFELSAFIRQRVHFQQGNVMTVLTRLTKQYDIIFCRNLLIYLHPEACSQVLQAIDQRLLSGGLLFLGASETGQLATSPHYTSIRRPFTFGFRKVAVDLLPTSPSQKSLKKRTQPRLSVPKSPQSAPNLREQSPKVERQLAPLPLQSQAPTQLQSDQDLYDLDTARTLANAGQLTTAATLCQTYLSQHRTSAAAYLLLGQIYQATKEDTQAEKCFQKALYLEPNSHEALVHLVLLKQHQGDLISAQILQQRIQRLQHSLEAGVQ
ncbi:chemotaxis protein CheR [Neosynechococcus sphagnicola sy1]|uniref:Chemotaxis protein CheR n=1 Tax=Neosynechococcus sphagnicola sy1 TaxID=1497020 RepID=A0A098TMX7_9CYAN|nr:CheR family methyltransferase [Neosynechococcus sphagnicola]KGF73596.1 chemotaxis protein CheR [Neosynechococcus sphagnicola sy1]